MGNLSGEAKASAAFFLLLFPQLSRSASHSTSVGILYPVGQGLFTPDTPCHKLSSLELRQSEGEVGAKIKLPFPGASIADKEGVSLFCSAPLLVVEDVHTMI